MKTHTVFYFNLHDYNASTSMVWHTELTQWKVKYNNTCRAMRYQNGCGLNTIRHFRNKKGTGPEMRPTILFLESLLGTSRSAIGQFFSLCLLTVPKGFENVNFLPGFAWKTQRLQTPRKTVIISLWQWYDRAINNNETERESKGVGLDMWISVKLFLEVVIKRKSNSWDVRTEYCNGDIPREQNVPLFFLDNTK